MRHSLNDLLISFHIFVENCDMKLGSLIKQVLDERGISVTEFARMLPCSRANAYKILLKEHLDSSLIQRISELLAYDFFKEYSTHLQIGDNQQLGD